MVNVGIDLISANIAMTLENWVLLLVVLGGVIFYASDTKLGILLHMLTTGTLFIVFYNTNLNFVPSLTVFFVFLVLLALTLLPVAKANERGAFV